MFLIAGQWSDFIDAPAFLETLPLAANRLANRGYDADWYNEGLEDKRITPCISPRKSRKTPIPNKEARDQNRYKIENSLAPLKDWGRVAT